jgi:hypothetical protein
MTQYWSCRQEKASGQQIEPRSAIHVPLQHLQPIALTFDGSLTPRQRHRRLDGSHVRPKPFSKAPEGRERARGSASQPWLERYRLAAADHAGKVLRQRHSFRQYGSVYRELL